jgi:hypothetical protein
MLGLDLSTWSALLAFLVFVLGGAVTLKPSLIDKHQLKLIVAFLVLGGVTFIVELRQSAESERLDLQKKNDDERMEMAREQERKEQRRTLNDLNELRRETGMLKQDLEVTARALRDSNSEQQRLLSQARASQDRIGQAQDKNLQLSNLNLELARRNTVLAAEAIQRTIGDPDNPPYLRFYDYDFGDSSKPRARAYLINSSNRYAARSVSLTIVLENQIYTSQSQDIPPSVGKINSRVPVEFPNTGFTDAWLIGLPHVAEAGKSGLVEVRITTAAGIYRQHLALQRISDKEIVQAWRVYREGDTSAPIAARQELTFPDDFKWPEFKPN